ncbi:GNAT family N-acetyltransferase [Aeromicrobium halocynthiae]
MRLTHVAHLRLPFGRVLGYELQVSSTADELPVSFDQRRHVAAGERPGSWMAITLRWDVDDLDALATAWRRVVERHGTLCSVFEPAEQPGTDPRLRAVTLGLGRWVEHETAPGARLSDAVRSILDTHCTPYSRPAHRLCVVQGADEATVVIAADHSHVDMWSLLVVARDLRAALDGRLDERPVPAFADHTVALRERPRAPEDVRARWREVLRDAGDVMPRFPLPLGDLEDPVPERVELRDVLDVDASAALSRRARELGVSTLALTTSVMTAATADLAGTGLRAVFPVHSRYDERWHDSVGWFITNSVVDSADASPAACAAAIKEAVRLGSYPLEDVLAPWGGMPQAPGMFAISWLDLRRLPVRIDHLGMQAQYVSAAGRTDGVMVWFVLDEDGMRLRCRYPDTTTARASVRSWLDAVVHGLRRQARRAGAEITVAGVEMLVDRAERTDVATIARLLADDPIGATRESLDLRDYEEAFDAISRDSSQFLAVVRDGEEVVATAQLSIVPGLSRGGATRLQIEGVRVDRHRRGRGLGSALLEWAHEHGRARGARLAQLTTDVERPEARRFYARHGYEATHVGLKRTL